MHIKQFVLTLSMIFFFWGGGAPGHWKFVVGVRAPPTSSYAPDVICVPMLGNEFQNTRCYRNIYTFYRE